MGGVGGILATVQRHNFNSYVCLVIFFRRAANSSSIARNIDFSFLRFIQGGNRIFVQNFFASDFEILLDPMILSDAWKCILLFSKCSFSKCVGLLLAVRLDPTR